MDPDSSQPKYHHYIPQFILRSFADNFSLEANGGRKNRKRKTYRIKVYQVEDKTTVLNDVRRSYGLEYMYRDIAEDDSMKFENLLAKMESVSSTFIRKIWTGEDENLSLTRAQLAEFKKFLAIMTYRSESRRGEYDEDRFNHKTRQSIRNHMRHKNISRIQDVWFDNLKWLIQTPIEEIMEESKRAMMSLMALGTGEYNGPIHIAELLEFGGACRNYMCIWQAEEGSEFILSEGCFGAWEGDMRDPFHTIYVVSPRYCIVLVNRLEIWNLATHLPFRSWFEGDIHAFPETVYQRGLPPPTPDMNFFSPGDVFKYRRITLPKEDVYFVNSIFLDARRKCLTYSSDLSMYNTLQYYDKMKKSRPDLFRNGHDYSILKRRLFDDINKIQKP
ncbi:hypothetical protein BKA57DRAFT_452474 [Linnemannia elongata]|nr:hypothetical protein BKA57DRAFT_452474 [Linnemannia elongata]